jgi:AcrR family transcriptional regulator
LVTARNARSAKPRTRDPDRAAKVLAAARRLFYERGFHAVGVDEIGEAAGATGAALYRSFSSKEDVLSVLFDEAQDRYLLAVPDASDDPVADIETLIDRTLALTLEERELASIWAHERRALSPERRRHMDRRSRHFVEQWVAILERAFPDCPEADLFDAARAAIGMITSVATRPGRVSEREQEVVREMLLAGLLAVGRRDT